MVPARHQFGNFCPLVAELFMGFKYHLLFQVAYRVLLDLWVQVVVPPMLILR